MDLVTCLNCIGYYLGYSKITGSSSLNTTASLALLFLASAPVSGVLSGPQSGEQNPYSPSPFRWKPWISVLRYSTIIYYNLELSILLGGAPELALHLPTKDPGCAGAVGLP